MRQLTIIFVFFVIKSYGQCDRDYLPSEFYHKSEFVTAQGDTLNKLDNSGLYEGLHLYTDNPNNLFDEMNSFAIGHYNHGQPFGDWKDHCKDGSYSIGQFRNKIYEKRGVWKYYDRDNNLIKTKKFDHIVYKNGWADNEFIVNSSGELILVKHDSKQWRFSVFKKEIYQAYSDSGVPIMAYYQNFWRDIEIIYHNNGNLKENRKCRKVFGIKTNRFICKSYSVDGKQIGKYKEKCVTTTEQPIDFW